MKVYQIMTKSKKNWIKKFKKTATMFFSLIKIVKQWSSIEFSHQFEKQHILRTINNQIKYKLTNKIIIYDDREFISNYAQLINEFFNL